MSMFLRLVSQVGLSGYKLAVALTGSPALLVLVSAVWGSSTLLFASIFSKAFSSFFCWLRYRERVVY